MTSKIKVGINGFGRIGRTFFRVNEIHKRHKIVAINDTIPDSKNLAYLLKYDSTYGKFETDVKAKADFFSVNGNKVQIFCKESIKDVPWEDLGVDVIVDASGVQLNVLHARYCLRDSVKKVIITHSPPVNLIDFTMILGVNEKKYDPQKHHIVSSSICDANAFAPVAKLINERCGIECGFLTTIHPYLAYQKVLDGPKQMETFSLGRASIGSLIPKKTSVVDATCKVIPELTGKIDCFSYRVPTAIVSTFDVSLRLKKDVTVDKFKSLFKRYRNPKWGNIIGYNEENLVSIDYLKSSFSVVIDGQWIKVKKGNFVKVVGWYDNEWSYCERVENIIEFLLRPKEDITRRVSKKVKKRK